jgi:hypothetical protein
MSARARLCCFMEVCSVYLNHCLTFFSVEMCIPQYADLKFVMSLFSVSIFRSSQDLFRLKFNWRKTSLRDQLDPEKITFSFNTRMIPFRVDRYCSERSKPFAVRRRITFVKSSKPILRSLRDLFVRGDRRCSCCLLSCQLPSQFFA